VQQVRSQAHHDLDQPSVLVGNVQLPHLHKTRQFGLV
jgi:hypothetical protein